MYQLVIQQLRISNENSFSSLLLQFVVVQIHEVQKRLIVNYCAVRTSTSVLYGGLDTS